MIRSRSHCFLVCRLVSIHRHGHTCTAHIALYNKQLRKQSSGLNLEILEIFNVRHSVHLFLPNALSKKLINHAVYFKILKTPQITITLS
jgi:hypothetical protein